MHRIEGGEVAERTLDDWLRRAAAHRRGIAERALADLDLTPAQYAVLEIVSEQPGVSAAEIARLEGLTPPTLSVIVGNLIRKNALAKRPHLENARIQQLSHTELGARLLAEGGARLSATQLRLRSTLPVEAEAQVTNWLRAIASSPP